MSKVVVTKEKLVAIGDALRDKTEATEAYTLDEMPEVIQGIETGGANFTISDASYMFYNKARLNNYDNIVKMFSDVSDMSYMFYGCDSKSYFPDVSVLDTGSVTTMNSMFFGCSYVETLDLSHFNTSKVTNMGHMFRNCQKLTNLNISSFNTSKVTNMSYMFNDCDSLTKLDLSHFDTSKVTDMSYMFYTNCKRLEELTGFSATNKAGINIAFPYSSSGSSKMALRRLTFRTDLPEGVCSIRSAINIKYCSFDREGMVEMFNTLPDISSLGLSASYTKITITGNPCLTDGTLTDDDRAIATSKGWTLVE